jgi:predicted nucleic acid-binding protein
MKIYFDVCCLNRPFDNQSQDRIRLETEAVKMILSRIAADEWQWLISSAVIAEIKQTPNSFRQKRMLLMLEQAGETIKITPEITVRARELENLSFKPFDALHIAIAEQGRVGIFLTVDDRLQRLANRLGKKIRVTIRNPLAWIREINK